MPNCRRCDWLIDWLVHLYPPITRKRRCAMLWTNPHPLRSWPFSKLSCWHFDFFPRKFAACSKPPSRDNYRKASYPRTQQRDQGAGWTHDPAIRVVVITTPLPIRPRCRLWMRFSSQIIHQIRIVDMQSIFCLFALSLFNLWCKVCFAKVGENTYKLQNYIH